METCCKPGVYVSGEKAGWQWGLIPLTEAGVEGSAEELCILTPVKRGPTFNIVQNKVTI